MRSLNNQTPRHLIISDVHKWMNKIPIIPGCSLANPQPREQAHANRQEKKTLLNLTLVTRERKGATKVKSKWKTSVAVQHHYSYRTSLVTSTKNERTMKARKRATRPVSSWGWSDKAARLRRDGHFRNGSLTGAIHLSKKNAGIQSRAHREWKSRAQHKGKCPVDRNLQSK